MLGKTKRLRSVPLILLTSSVLNPKNMELSMVCRPFSQVVTAFKFGTGFVLLIFHFWIRPHTCNSCFFLLFFLTAPFIKLAGRLLRVSCQLTERASPVGPPRTSQRSRYTPDGVILATWPFGGSWWGCSLMQLVTFLARTGPGWT